ncbi:hypothetical protein [Phocaeicola plebeius]|uniref:hypothetical protein n=1 Tax=Phocaeicola plebeius TaxID=310297 RepID=UPI00195A3B69|nr:hypothetical protein [Phocaeicola plebeius]MBM6845365.1 hypothetical protein [Phocaeicola plebeius]
MKYLKKITWILLTINQAFIPIDKLISLPLLGYYFYKGKSPLKYKYLLFSILTLLFIFTTIWANPNSNILLIFPVIFGLLAFLVYDSEEDINIIQKALLLNIYFGLLSAILQTIGFSLIGNKSLYEKGLPFLYAPVGFSPTLQVYGTICITWLMIAFEKKQSLSFNYFIVTIATLYTLNRATLITFFLLLFIYKRKFALSLIITVLITILATPFLKENLFSTATMESRGDLRLGADISYWQSNDILIYLIGRGTHFTTEEISNLTFWGLSYIENGVDFIFHSYGIIGFILYISFVLTIIFTIYQNGKLHLILLVVYYFLIEQQFTNEFLSSSFCLFTASILLLSKNNIGNKKEYYEKNSMLSPLQ